MSLAHLPIAITTDTFLTGADVVCSPTCGWITVGPNFNGTTIKMASGFAASLATELGSPPLLTPFALDITYVGPRDNSVTLVISDPDIDVTNSSTMMSHHGNITAEKSASLLFVLTQVAPPTWNVYG